MKQSKPTKIEVAQMLNEALEPFCETMKELRPSLAHPFRQKDGDGQDCALASNGHILVRIRAKEAGIAISPFVKMDDFDAHKPIPEVGFEDLMKARTLRLSDLQSAINEMKQYEQEQKQVTAASFGGVWLSLVAVMHIEAVMRICGAEAARLVWKKGGKVVLQLDNEKGQEAVTILHMGFSPDDAHVITPLTTEGCDHCAVCIDWQKGIAAWADIKAEMEREAEAERMARREVYMVQMVKIAYIPVYAKNAEEARQLADSEAWYEPEDDGDDMWLLGDEVPEAEDIDYIADCYKHVITRDGIVERDRIYELDQISEEWQEKHQKEGE